MTRRALAYGVMFGSVLWTWGLLGLFVVGRWAA